MIRELKYRISSDVELKGINDFNTGLQNTKTLASALTNLLQGNFAGALFKVREYLQDLSRTSAIAKTALGSMTAALGGWQVGRMLDEKFKLSDRIAKAFAVQVDNDPIYDAIQAIRAYRVELEKLDQVHFEQLTKRLDAVSRQTTEAVGQLQRRFAALRMHSEASAELLKAHLAPDDERGRRDVDRVAEEDRLASHVEELASLIGQRQGELQAAFKEKWVLEKDSERKGQILENAKAAYAEFLARNTPRTVNTPYGEFQAGLQGKAFDAAKAAQMGVVGAAQVEYNSAVLRRDAEKNGVAALTDRITGLNAAIEDLNEELAAAKEQAEAAAIAFAKQAETEAFAERRKQAVTDFAAEAAGVTSGASAAGNAAVEQFRVRGQETTDRAGAESRVRNRMEEERIAGLSREDQLTAFRKKRDAALKTAQSQVGPGGVIQNADVWEKAANDFLDAQQRVRAIEAEMASEAKQRAERVDAARKGLADAGAPRTLQGSWQDLSRWKEFEEGRDPWSKVAEARGGRRSLGDSLNRGKLRRGNGVIRGIREEASEFDARLQADQERKINAGLSPEDALTVMAKQQTQYLKEIRDNTGAPVLKPGGNPR